jgi:hypothetical protein
MADYLQLSRLLAATVGQGMMQFTQALAPQAEPRADTSGQMASLETGKGFDSDQIAKLKDTCGMKLATDIPHILYVIQTTKSEVYDTYRDHLKKSIKSWCCTWHVEWDKLIYLTAKFFDDLVSLRFNPGRPVAQYNLVARDISMLSCR